MQLRFLGAHNCETKDKLLPGLLLDGHIAFDCGSLSRSLTEEELLAVKDVFLTHRHFDHIRDVVTLAMTDLQFGGKFTIYGNEETKDAIQSHLYNHCLYSDFFKKEIASYHVIENGTPVILEDYSVTPYAVNHGVKSHGYLVEKGGRSFFYTGDISLKNNDTWSRIKPDVLIIEVTCDNSFTAKFTSGPHLTPELLGEELKVFREFHGYIPEVYTVHMSANREAQIRTEIEDLAAELNAEIIVGHEDLVIEV
jgi:ribonuclease BN (tRNA processing enzyme)